MRKVAKISFAWVLVLSLVGIPYAAYAAVSEAEVHSAWAKVASATGLEKLPFNIKEDKTPNAWVANGSSVTVTTALMKVLDSEAEMYGVLAHEAGHAALNHYQGAVNTNVGIAILGSVLSSVLGGGVADIAVGAGSNLAAAGFSRKQEVAADDFSVDLAFKQGMDPTGLYTALMRLSIVGGKTEPNGFNSHPPDDRRLQHIRERVLARDKDVRFPTREEVKSTVPPELLRSDQKQQDGS